MSIVSELNKPYEWRLAPLGRLTVRTQIRERPDLEPLSVFLDEGVVPRSYRDDNHNRLGEDLSKYLVVAPGDIVFNKLRTWQGGLGVSGHTGIVSPAYFVCRPLKDVNPRFLHYLLRSSVYLQELTRISKWMPPSQFDISWDQLRRLPVLLPCIKLQHDIADYLDTTTTRIDSLISKKRRMLELIDERLQAQHDDWFQSLASVHGFVSIRRWSHIIEQGWSPVCDSEPAGLGESGVIKTSAVSSGRFVAANNKRLPPETECDTRWLLHDGDLLVTRGSGSRSMVGRACVAYVGKQSLTLSDLVYRVRLTRADPEFVAAALFSSFARAQIESSIRTDAGLTLKIRRDDLADIRVPAAPFDCQVSDVAKLRDRLSPQHAAKLRIERQIELLTERKQALISALVSGELPVPEVSP